jgi:hypothetical protein
MSQPWHLGNDIVDLADPRHGGKAGDARFLERVFSHDEREAILSSADPDRALWARWAGKEAAFKTVSKALGRPPTFNHPRFQVVLEESPTSTEADLPSTRFGLVLYEGLELPLRVEISGTTLHAVSWSPHPPGATPPFSWGFRSVEGEEAGWKEGLRPRFTSREWDCISHHPSALARLAARESVATSLGVEERALEVACHPGHPGRRIPRVFLAGREIPVDLTLSHHGRLLAWAFLKL